MTTLVSSESQIDSYLARVRTALRGLPERELEDILRELRSHVSELAETEGPKEALRSLGDPVDLAKTYRTENQMARAECSGSPLVILQGLRHSSSSWWGRFLVTVVYVFFYANVVTLWAAPIEKLIAPSRTGFFYTPGSFWSLTLVTDGHAPAGSREVLGWWLIPATLVAGWVLRYLIDHVARWWIRRYRRSQAAPAM